MDTELELTNKVVEAFTAAFRAREEALLTLDGDGQRRLNFHVNDRFLGDAPKARIPLVPEASTGARRGPKPRGEQAESVPVSQIREHRPETAKTATG